MTAWQTEELQKMYRVTAMGMEMFHTVSAIDIFQLPLR